MSQTVAVRLDEEVLEQLDIMAKAADRSRAWLMAQAIRQYVQHEAWQVDAIKKALTKLESGKARFTPQEEVAQWLLSWGTTREKDRPSCE